MSKAGLTTGKAMHGVIVSDDPEIAGRIRGVLRQQLWECGTADTIGTLSAGSQLPYLQPEMVFVVLPKDAHPANGSAQSLRRVRDATSASVVAVGPGDDSRLILGCLHEGGADQYVALDKLEEEIEDVIEREHPAVSGKIIAVVSPGGGAGASTLAVSLAASLACEDQPCALLDLNLSFGDLASLLDLKPTRSIADFCRNVSRVDRAMFEQMLVPHDTGIHLLAAPLSFDDERVVSTEGVVMALKIARELFPYVVLDMDHTGHEEQGAAFRMADAVLVLFRPDYTSLHNVRQQLVFLEKLGVKPGKIRLIANGYGRAKQLTVAQVEECLKIKISDWLPDDPRHVNLSNNKGAPMVVEFPFAKYSRKVRGMAKLLAQQFASAASAPRNENHGKY